MTGLHTGHCYIRGNKEVKPEGQHPLPKDTVTLPKLLKQAGYQTGAFGKWGLGAPGSTGDPANHFDVFYGYNCQREAHTYYPDHLWHNKQKVPLDSKTYSHNLIMDQAISFIEKNQKGPFFCFLPITIPHAAMHTPEKYAAPFRKKFPQFANKIGKYKGPEVKNPIATFAGMMTHVDQDVGRLLALLKELNIDENTIVMFSSDNGPHKEGGHDPEFFDSNGPFRGFKRDLYEGGIRTVMLARWPGTIPMGTFSDAISAHWDILPTCCELAGISPPQVCDGISFVPTFFNKAQKEHYFLYWEFHERGGKRAVRFGPWKAVQLNLQKNANGPIELFNLEKDIGETQNVAAAHPEQIAKVKTLFREAHTPSKVWPIRSLGEDALK